MSDGRKLSGQQYDPENDIYIPFVEQVLDYSGHDTTVARTTGSEGLLRAEQIPMDGNAARLRTFDISTVQGELDSYSLKWPGVLPQLNLPDILKGVDVVYTKNKGEGHHTEHGNGTSAGTSASLSLSLSGRAQSSLAISADVTVNIKRIQAQQIPVTNIAFYQSGSMTQAQLLTRCSSVLGQTVLAWPVFQPETHTIVLKSRNMSISVEASIQQSVSIGTTGTWVWGKGEGASYEAGLTTRTIQIPPTIHGLIPINVTSDFDVLTARAHVSWPGNINWPAQDSESILTTDPIRAEISPDRFNATTPSAIPSSGYYLYDVQFFQPKWSYTRVHAMIVNFADIPNA